MNISVINDEISDNLDESIDFLRRNQISFIELRSIEGKNIIDFSDEELHKVSNNLKENSIKVSAFASPLFKWWTGHSTPDRDKRVDSYFFNPFLDNLKKKAYIKRAMEVAKLLDTQYVRIFSCLKNNKEKHGSYNFLKDPILVYACKEAEKLGITLLLENEPVCHISTKKQVQDFINKKPEHIKLWFDIANIYRENENMSFQDLNMWKEEIKYVHLKDFDFQTSEYVPFGTGSVNYKRIISDMTKLLADDVILSLETHVKVDRKRAMSLSIKNLRQYINTPRISYGLVGCGRITRKHIEAIRNNSNSELRACYDIKPKISVNFSSINDCEDKGSIAMMMQDDNVDVITVCTPHHTHKDIIIKAIKAGKHCLCEKPICLTSKEGQEIIKVGKNKVNVVLQNRYNPPVKYLFKLIKENKLGKIRYCSAKIIWYRDKEYFMDEWHGDISKVGGMLFNQAIHTLDLVYLICGKAKQINYLSKNLRNDVEDFYVANIEFENGIIGNIESTTYSTNKNFECSITVIGDKGMIKVGGIALNKLEYLCLDNEEENKQALSVDIQGDVYGGGHTELISKLSDSLISKQPKKSLVYAKEAVDLTNFINLLYKN